MTGSLTANGRFRLLVDAITDYAIYMLDPAGFISSWNAGAERLKGYKEAEILGEHFSRFYTDEDRASGLPARALSISAAEGKFEAEGWRVRKDGERFWAHVVIDPIFSPSRELLGYAKITRDLTERKLAQQELRKSEEQFRALVQGVTDYSIYRIDPEGVIESWNMGAERIKGYRPEEIIGQHFSRFYTEADRARGEPAHTLAIATQEGRFENEGLRVRKDGTTFWAHVVVDAIQDEDRNLIGFAKITRDITERRNAERALEETRRALFQAQKMEAVGQLTGGIAHDFNNLLTVIIGGLESIERQVPSLEDSPAKARIARSRELAATGAQRAATLTTRLLAFSRQQPLAPKALDVNRLVSGVTELLRRTLGETISLQTVLGAGVWPTFIDDNQLENALINLAINARDAMPRGGKLTIETANSELDDAYVEAVTEPVATGQYVLLAVTDTGTGMDGATLEKAFEPFFTTKAVGKGTGLGLSQVYGFIRQSSGHIRIYSELGVGTTVKLYLPRYYGQTEMPKTRKEFAPEPAVGAESILVVEDDDALRGHAAEMLKELGYQVLQASDGTAALRLIEEYPDIDLLFTDVVMPGITGRQLADKARIMRPQIKILFTTGYTRNAIVHNGQLDVGVQLISKPYTFQNLAAKIRRCLDTEADVGSG